MSVCWQGELGLIGKSFKSSSSSVQVTSSLTLSLLDTSSLTYSSSSMVL
uniref:Uncharacterized protein n=1 Tax=Rhizophora mucronata TaxID=61149 RepID=A0A2P2NVF2_RHIMU